MIDMTMSLDGFVAGDGKDYPRAKHDGMRIFDWYCSGKAPYRSELAIVMISLPPGGREGHRLYFLFR